MPFPVKPVQLNGSMAITIAYAVPVIIAGQKYAALLSEIFPGQTGDIFLPVYDLYLTRYRVSLSRPNFP